MQAVRIFRRSIAECDASQRCAELTAHFGVPCSLRAVWGTSYGWEHRRLRQGEMPIGCLNQPWLGPAVVWYPEGDWISETQTGKVIVDEEV